MKTKIGVSPNGMVTDFDSVYRSSTLLTPGECYFLNNILYIKGRT